MKKTTVMLIAILMMAVNASAQIEDLFSDENFISQPQMTEKEIKAFTSNPEILNQLSKAVEQEEAGQPMDTKALDKQIKKATGMGLDRYVYVLTKVTTTSYIMFNFDEATADSYFQQMPEYIRPNSVEKLLIKRYQKEIEATISEMDGY